VCPADKAGRTGSRWQLRIFRRGRDRAPGPTPLPGCCPWLTSPNADHTHAPAVSQAPRTTSAPPRRSRKRDLPLDSSSLPPFPIDSPPRVTRATHNLALTHQAPRAFSNSGSRWVKEKSHALAALLGTYLPYELNVYDDSLLLRNAMWPVMQGNGAIGRIECRCHAAPPALYSSFIHLPSRHTFTRPYHATLNMFREIFTSHLPFRFSSISLL
jgi:hypothetical protein